MCVTLFMLIGKKSNNYEIYSNTRQHIFRNCKILTVRCALLEKYSQGETLEDREETFRIFEVSSVAKISSSSQEASVKNANGAPARDCGLLRLRERVRKVGAIVNLKLILILIANSRNSSMK